MRVYETTFVINPQTDDTTIDRQVQAVADTIKSNGGKPTHENRMGTRRMAYEIKGLSQGYYTSIIFESPTETLEQLDRLYQLEEAYVRYLTVLYEGPDPDELDQRRAAGEFPFSRGDRPPRGGRRDDRPGPKPAAGAKPAAEKPAAEKPAAAEATPEEKPAETAAAAAPAEAPSEELKETAEPVAEPAPEKPAEEEEL